MKFKDQENDYEDKGQIIDINDDSSCSTGCYDSSCIDNEDYYNNMPMPCGMIPYGMMPYGIVPGIPEMMPAPNQYYPQKDNDTIYNSAYSDSENDDEDYDPDNMTRSRRRRRRRRRYDYPYYYPGGFPFWLWWFL
ncbi:MAG: hypothetical protein LKE46_03125 [Clostridium sp.]|uniref:hypothetical protein n=1 Tax=Clostridium sp. TaxID=1506 RepID=UPI0025B9883E|nr:hypothetical protein [Clostridium sp.]MCH3963241.1 hypothetical protein [Clostridium sp.]MCI1717213.1 hypothetical protein [Clostridium sp.]MCI1801553.1 hypothetical protein [Clostridium sp.]MCI1815399.1 hypothetical protein [Clostridium sp.]MCI1872302.1 hypothetical protein [Clostridium sp.]